MRLGHNGRWTRAAGTDHFSSKIILATNEDRAIDLSCRACGAGAWALGLDSRLGTPASLPSFFPTSDSQQAGGLSKKANGMKTYGVDQEDYGINTKQRHAMTRLH